jgi:hypothetical protein
MFLVKHSEQHQHDTPQHVLPSQSLEETPLETAIKSASRTQLCQILRQICAHSKTATEMTRNHLIPRPEKVEAPKEATLRSILKKPGASKRSSQQQTSPPTEKTPNGTPQSSQIQSQGHTKRKATTQCRNCGCEYSSSNSDVAVCTHHPGK